MRSRSIARNGQAAKNFVSLKKLPSSLCLDEEGECFIAA